MSTTVTPKHEKQLIRAVKRNPKAFHRLYQHYFPRVYAYVAYRVGNVQDTEDIVANIFLKVVKAIHQFEYRGEGSFSAWVFRIAHNHVQQFFRDNGREPTRISLDDLPDIQGESPSPDSTVMAKERFARLREQIATLSPRRQEIITLRYFGELRNQEIATVLDLDERTVASHLSRGLDDLARKYEYESERD